MNPWLGIIEIARFAPSPHNTQPWQLRVIDDRTAELLLVRERTLPDEDVTGCFIFCAMGIFIESVRIIAVNRGLALRAESFPMSDTGPISPYAKLTLESDSSGSAEFSDALFLSRRTSRLSPTADLIDQATIMALTQAASAGGQVFHHIHEAMMIRDILDRNVDAVFHDLNDSRYHDEIVGWFRYGLRHEERTRDGLASRCMNMTAFELYMTAKFPRLMTVPIGRRIMRTLYHARLGSAHQMGFLAGPFWTRTDAERAGACLLRLWLTLTAHGGYLHPFGNLVTNAEAHHWLSNRLGIENIWLAFRFGRTAEPPRSLRLSTEQLLHA